MSSSASNYSCSRNISCMSPLLVAVWVCSSEGGMGVSSKYHMFIYLKNCSSHRQVIEGRSGSTNHIATWKLKTITSATIWPRGTSALHIYSWVFDLLLDKEGWGGGNMNEFWNFAPTTSYPRDRGWIFHTCFICCWLDAPIASWPWMSPINYR